MWPGSNPYKKSIKKPQSFNFDLVNQYADLRQGLQAPVSSYSAPPALTPSPGISSASPAILGPSTGKGGLTPAEQWLIQKESGGRTTAKNPKSTAFGLGQLLIANRRKYLPGNPDTTDYDQQLDAFRRYVADRYGSAQAAVAFHRQKGWY